MIAVDTNVLVYAHRVDSAWHAPARAAVAKLAESPARWAIPWPCVHEFVGIVTHPRIYAPPSPTDIALSQVDAWLEMPNLVTLGEPADYWPNLRSAVIAGKVVGPRIHDARIAALCVAHGVRELWSADRDFSRFAGMRVHNPLVM